MASTSPKRRRTRQPKVRAKKQAPSKNPAKRTIADVPTTTKLAAMIAVLTTPKGATLPQLMALTGWQAHSVRGAMSGAVKKHCGCSVVSQKIGSDRVYRIKDGK